MIGTRGLPATFGGVERAVEELSVRLGSAGHEVTVYCRTAYSTTRAPEYRGVRLRYLPAVYTKHLEAISHTLLATVDAIFRRYDIVHFHGIGPSLCTPLARLGGLHVVSTVHSLDFRAGKWGRVARLTLRLGALVAAHVPHRTLAVSRGLQEYFASEYGCQTTYVPNGVEIPPAAAGTDAGERLRGGHLLFLGRLVPEKGVHTLIEAYRGIETDVRLVIAGPSSHSEDYERRLRELARHDPRISLVGLVYGEEKAKLVTHTYAFCQPSTHEGLPIALLEMMSEAICPIVSDIPEHLEVVSTDGASPTALVFRAGDAASLRNALATALERPELVAELGAAARKIVVARYSWNDVARAVESVYEEVLKA
jgi:glycosyltransferase involved in cell wall biosynthesis